LKSLFKEKVFRTHDDSFEVEVLVPSHLTSNPLPLPEEEERFGLALVGTTEFGKPRDEALQDNL
jgi:hypothetical protein